MADRELVELIRGRIPGLALRENEPMSRHCSFRVGGPAEIFAEPSGEGELLELCSILTEEHVPALVIGRGTNLLVCDEGIAGVVIHLGDAFSEARVEGTEIYALAGCPLSRLAVMARRTLLARFARPAGKAHGRCAKGIFPRRMSSEK